MTNSMPPVTTTSVYSPAIAMASTVPPTAAMSTTRARQSDLAALQQFQLDIKNGVCYDHLFPGQATPYGYGPSLAAGITFVVLFSLCMFAHLSQLWRFRRVTSILLAIGALTELIGWIGRAWSAKCPYDGDAFLMQITTLIIAPTFFTAALYVILGQMINILGARSSLLSARTYAIVFCTCDVISLVLQAIGGGMASVAADEVDGDTKPGTNIMVAGIGFQMVTMTLFTFFVGDFVYRTVRHIGLPPQYRSVLLASVTSLVMIFVRSIYRTIELAQGWDGYLITREGFFIGFDAVTMVIACAIFLLSDPAAKIPLAGKTTAKSRDNYLETDDGGNYAMKSASYNAGRDDGRESEVSTPIDPREFERV